MMFLLVYVQQKSCKTHINNHKIERPLDLHGRKQSHSSADAIAMAQMCQR